MKPEDVKELLTKLDDCDKRHVHYYHIEVAEARELAEAWLRLAELINPADLKALLAVHGDSRIFSTSDIRRALFGGPE